MSPMTQYYRSIVISVQDISEIPPIPPFEWKYTPYGTPKEDIPKDAPIPRGKRIILTHYFDANLMHDILSGKSVTGVIHFWNKHQWIVLLSNKSIQISHTSKN